MESEDKRKYESGKKYARTFNKSEIEPIADSLILGDFDTMDWFEDKPDKFFLAGFKNEKMNLDSSF